jgi:3-hydroxy acid dehydrogenase/malonic semialdehyde reductase
MKLAFVTGATAGFGRAIVNRLVADGSRVIATGRREDRLHALHADLGDAVLPLRLDVTDAEAVAALPGSLPAAWQDIDLLVNNAGLALGL